MSLYKWKCEADVRAAPQDWKDAVLDIAAACRQDNARSRLAEAISPIGPDTSSRTCCYWMALAYGSASEHCP